MSALSVIFLVAVNMVPLFGVVFFGWNLFSVMILYWAESGIVGLLNVPKIILARAPNAADQRFTINGRDASSLGKFFIVPFFVFHYGLFWGVHGVFVVVLFGLLGGSFAFPGSDPSSFALGSTNGFASGFASGFAGFEPFGVGVALLSIFVSHALSFFVNFVGREEYRSVSPAEQMFQPYSRVVVLQVTILGGGALAGYFGAPLAALVVLVLLKTCVDVAAHLRERRKAREAAPENVSETRSENESETASA